MENNKKSPFNVKDITEISILVSFAVVLDLFVKIPLAANGGSINFSMLPLLILALRKEWWKTFISSAIVFGIITCLFDGYGLITYPLDYMLGFGSVSILSVFRNKIIKNDGSVTVSSFIYSFIGITICFLLRLLFSTISGVVIYKLSIEGSISYQITYIFPTYLVDLICFLLLLKPISIIFKNH